MQRPLRTEYQELEKLTQLKTPQDEHLETSDSYPLETSPSSGNFPFPLAFAGIVSSTVHTVITGFSRESIYFVLHIIQAGK